MKFFAASVPVILLVFAFGCAEPYSRGSASSPGSQVVSYPAQPGYTTGSVASASDGSSASPSDIALSSNVQSALRENREVSAFANNIQAQARSGVVTVTGSVPTDAARQSIDNVVRNLPGVNRVYDQLVIQPNAVGTQTYPSNTQAGQTTTIGANPGQARAGDIFNLHVQGLNEPDRTLAQNILSGLETDQVLSAMLPTVDINVSGGRVLLQGTVQTDKQKQAIGTVVERAAGQNNVVNNLQVSGR